MKQGEAARTEMIAIKALKYGDFSGQACLVTFHEFARDCIGGEVRILSPRPATG
jgi:hypothetical protein